MTTASYAILFFGALAGGFVSGLAGFGTALMALGIWLYVLPPTLAVPLVLVCSVIAQVSTLPSIWKTIDFRLVWPFVICGLAGVPIGILLIARADPDVFKLTIGVFLLVFPTLLFLQRKPMSISFGGTWADGAIGFAGGILGGLDAYTVRYGAGLPPMLGRSTVLAAAVVTQGQLDQSITAEVRHQGFDWLGFYVQGVAFTLDGAQATRVLPAEFGRGGDR